ncbi:hypothetical protein ACIF6K_28635 [Streptomyces sp. NPDC085942]
MKPFMRASSMWAYLSSQSSTAVELFQRATSSMSSQVEAGLTGWIRR